MFTACSCEHLLSSLSLPSPRLHLSPMIAHSTLSCPHKSLYLECPDPEALSPATLPILFLIFILTKLGVVLRVQHTFVDFSLLTDMLCSLSHAHLHRDCFLSSEKLSSPLSQPSRLTPTQTFYPMTLSLEI
jgi:hypothetical protein